MVNHKVSLRYATSLLESSLEKNSLDTVSEQVELVYSSTKASPELLRMLSSPVVKPEIKLSVMTEIFRNRIGDELINFIRFVIEKRREDQLINILEKYLNLRDEHSGIVNVFINTAFEFTEEQASGLKTKFETALNKKVRLKFVIDKNVIGGFIAKVDDTVYDASVRHQLELLKKEFLSGGASLN